MSQTESYAAKIIAEAESLLGKVQRDLDDAAEFYRANDINPDKLLSAVEPHLGAQEKQELAKLAQADQEAIQRDVDEGLARASFNSGGSGSSGGSGVKKPRPMV